MLTQKLPIRLFERSFYALPDPRSKAGYGKIVRPSNEFSMHVDCMLALRELKWRCVAHEWYVTPGSTHNGQGDLVFQQPHQFLVMEVKRRNSKYVYEQAEFYAAVWKLLYTPDTDTRVFYGVWTSYYQEITGLIDNDDVAHDICMRMRRTKISKVS